MREQPRTVGQRIAYWRNHRGKTQEVLAGLVGRSASWLTKIERGELTLDKISVLLKLANVLKVQPSDIIGGISLPPNGGEPLDPPRGIIAIHRALFAVPSPGERLDTNELRTDVEQAKRLDGEGSYEALAAVLPDLIVASRGAVAQELPGGWWCLAGAYQVASSLVRELGHLDLACTTADRAVDAAQRSDDKLMVALSQQRLCGALMRQGWLDEAGAVCSDAADAIAPTDDTPPEGWSVWGLLHLVEALIAVRAGDTPGAWRVLRHARAAAERVGPGRNDYWQAFGPANVGTIEVAVALESGDAVEALRIADRVEVDELPMAERRARFCLSAAKARVLRGDDGAAVALLLEGERHSSEVIRYSVEAHELVGVCLKREHRSRTPGLRGLATRLDAFE